MDMMQKFASGKLIVFTNSHEESVRFLEECTRENLYLAFFGVSYNHNYQLSKFFPVRCGFACAYIMPNAIIYGAEKEWNIPLYEKMERVEYLDIAGAQLYRIEAPV